MPRRGASAQRGSYGHQHGVLPGDTRSRTRIRIHGRGWRGGGDGQGEHDERCCSVCSPAIVSIVRSVPLSLEGVCHTFRPRAGRSRQERVGDDIETFVLFSWYFRTILSVLSCRLREAHLIPGARTATNFAFFPSLPRAHLIDASAGYPSSQRPHERSAEERHK